MTIHGSARTPLRLWPGIALVVMQMIAFIVVPLLTPDAEVPYGMLGGVAASLLIWLWWLLFSRAWWLERLGAIALLVIAIIGSKPLVDQSIAGAGQGLLMYGLGIVPTAVALVAWAVLTRNRRGGLRWVTLVAAMVIGIMPFHLVRTPGVDGGAMFAIDWRWTPTPEELLLAQGPEQLKPLDTGASSAAGAPSTPTQTPAPSAPAPVASVTPDAPDAPDALGAAEWPGFRGRNRDSVVRNVRISTDWSASPPVQMWRRPVGPGWSSFSVRGDLLYTQEQRGNEEIVACYRVSTGEPVWRHADPVRFYESNGGAGPRGTPTIDKDRVYSMGATGVLNALDARTGKKIWSLDTSKDTSREVPFWGISSSPLVVGDVVIVSVGGTLAGYDVATGKKRWTGPAHGGSYSSPHLVTIDGVTQVVILSSPGAVSVDPADGKLLWDYKWEGGAIIQPAVTDDGDLLINAMSAMGGMGTKRLTIKHDANGWTPEERWTTNGMKPYFNDYVIHKGHAYGFDNNILACIDLADGKRKWKGGRYGNGQMLLIADQDLLLVTSEEGELALVSATTDQYREIAKIPLFDAKTWNHPVIVGNVLLVRNGEEMAAFRLGTEAARNSIER
ncbi:MAG: PQQ-like beta-propeller repeat protein [Cyanobacteria bacterium]|nr:PQQ-like beta-propeller repeat protein [Cyanobacteriota bacterium]